MGSSTLRTAKNLPTHLSLSEFILALLPSHPRDVPPVYHQPRYANYNPATTYVHDVVLSITPTAGVYVQLHALASARRPFKPFCFLHRPFNLDRRGVPYGTLVQASHKRFDELLTVGWNTVLAVCLGLDLQTAVCIQGYKGDPERRIGLVAKLTEPSNLSVVHESILKQFGTGKLFPVNKEVDLDNRIDGVAIMNAFGPDEVARAVDAAVQAGFVAPDDHAHLLYLTGEPKDMGLLALAEKFAGMTAVCVGHREAEEWGIRYLGAAIKQQWSEVNVTMVFEEEEVVKKDKNVTDVSSNHIGGGT